MSVCVLCTLDSEPWRFFEAYKVFPDYFTSLNMCPYFSLELALHMRPDCRCSTLDAARLANTYMDWNWTSLVHSMYSVICAVIIIKVLSAFFQVVPDQALRSETPCILCCVVHRIQVHNGSHEAVQSAVIAGNFECIATATCRSHPM